MSKPSSFERYLQLFRDFYFSYRTIPTFEITKEIIWVQSKSAVHRFFQQMVEYWFLSKTDWNYLPANKLIGLPLFSSVQAWQPLEVLDTTCEQINVENYLVDNPNSTVLLSVKWESMIDAGLHEGDLVVVDRWKEARMWDMVIAVVDNEYTVKWLEKWDSDKHPWILQPSNEKFSPIIPKWSLTIYGVVVWSMRKYT